ncbi:MAG: HAMP domain-containing sensor histidine kinase [Myxococcota bacterium]
MQPLRQASLDDAPHLPDMEALDVERRSQTAKLIALTEICAATPQAVILSFVDARPVAIIVGLIAGWGLTIAASHVGYRTLARVLLFTVNLFGYVALGFLLGVPSGFHTIAFIFPPMVLLLVRPSERWFFWSGLVVPGLLYFLVTLGSPIEPIDLGALTQTTYLSMSVSAFAVIATMLFAAAQMSKATIDMLSELVQLVVKERDARLEADNAKSAFLANMSHELRTPLNAIIGYAQLLQEDLESDEPIRLDIERIQLAGSHLLALVNDVLDLSKIEAGKLDLRIERLDLVPLFDEVCALLEGLALRRHNSLDVYIDPKARFLPGDPERLKQVLVNLAGNAIKFTERGVVRLSADLRAQEVVIVVQDDGIGMHEDDLQRVFEAFEQADKSTTRVYGGTGLGLTLCRELTRLMGGRMEVKSTLGEGSTFSVHLPSAVPKQAADNEAVRPRPRSWNPKTSSA